MSMQLSSISSAPYQVNVNRVGASNQQNVGHLLPKKTPSIASYKNSVSNPFMFQETGNAFSEINVETRTPAESRRTPHNRRACIVLIVIGVILAIMVSVVAVVLAIILQRSSPTSSTTVTTTYVVTTSTASSITTVTTTTTTTSATTTRCSNRGRGNLGLLTGYASSNWTQYIYTFTATSIQHILVFGFEVAMNHSWILDDVSVVRNNVAYFQLLGNPGFEFSNTSIAGWVQWCSSYCHYGTNGKILSSTDCYSGSGNCYINSCYGPAVEFLGQYFSSVPGSTYTVSFRLLLTESDGDPNTMFYVDIF